MTDHAREGVSGLAARISVVIASADAHAQNPDQHHSRFASWRRDLPLQENTGPFQKDLPHR